VYAGILEESVRHAGRMQLVVQAFTTRMSDAQRMLVIDEAADAVQHHYDNLRAFNHQNRLLRLQRAKTTEEVNQIKAIYGME